MELSRFTMSERRMANENFRKKRAAPVTMKAELRRLREREEESEEEGRAKRKGERRGRESERDIQCVLLY